MMERIPTIVTELYDFEACHILPTMQDCNAMTSKGESAGSIRVLHNAYEWQKKERTGLLTTSPHSRSLGVIDILQ